MSVSGSLVRPQLPPVISTLTRSPVKWYLHLDSNNWSSPGRFLGHQPKNGETDGCPSQKKARVAESNIQYWSVSIQGYSNNSPLHSKSFLAPPHLDTHVWKTKRFCTAAMNSLMSLEAQQWSSEADGVRQEWPLSVLTDLPDGRCVCFSFQAVDAKSFHTRGYQTQKHSHWLQHSM